MSATGLELRRILHCIDPFHEYHDPAETVVLTCVCLTLLHYSYDMTDVPTLMLCSGTFIGYIVVFSGEIVGEIVSAAADAYVDAWWSATGAALFGACGWLTMNGWRDVPPSTRRTHAQAAGICAIVTATILALDAILAICSAHKEDNSSRTCSKSQHRAGHI
ncbi:uncharacterized protein LOC113233963 [Hyposmocoma kahamanoa]|uniref:uncharacterized protein LOC113233963 n=1 Tax=Hyposmocoma kahamanoa TaxID=1477025 RepID=UPI000E6D6C17|nr:uncharacterized protein LOC113233963 [Hyposmocoma kahamanoa]